MTGVALAMLEPTLQFIAGNHGKFCLVIVGSCGCKCNDQ